MQASPTENSDHYTSLSKSRSKLCKTALWLNAKEAT